MTFRCDNLCCWKCNQKYSPGFYVQIKDDLLITQEILLLATSSLLATVLANILPINSITPAFIQTTFLLCFFPAFPGSISWLPLPKWPKESRKVEFYILDCKQPVTCLVTYKKILELQSILMSSYDINVLSIIPYPAGSLDLSP